MFLVRMLDACVLCWDGWDVVAKMEQRQQRFPVRIMLLHEWHLWYGESSGKIRDQLQYTVVYWGIRSLIIIIS